MSGWDSSSWKSVGLGRMSVKYIGLDDKTGKCMMMKNPEGTDTQYL